MKLVIAEKRELAKAIVEAIGNGRSQDGYYDCGEIWVTYCFGHMLRPFEPHEYDPKYKSWNLSHLPIFPADWRKKVSSDKVKQYNKIVDLIAKADSIIHAGDPDPEGQLIVDSILEREKCTKPVYRLLTNDNNPKIIQREMQSLKDNRDFRGLGLVAEARSRADQVWGFNLSRAYTIYAGQRGFQGVLTVGRVQTPILGLVVRRDRGFESHKPEIFYQIQANCIVSSYQITGKLIPAEDDPLDENGRIRDKEFAVSLAAKLVGQPVSIVLVKTVSKVENPPLPYNLLKLQADASEQHGITATKVKEITQNLRDKFRLITYNRTDCQYLNEEKHADAPQVLKVVAANLPDFQYMVSATDSSIKGRVFDNSKVSAHHAIIPTESTPNMDDLSDTERTIYMMIARRYLQQFLPDHRFDETLVEFSIGNRCFSTKSKVSTTLGWRVYENSETSDDEAKDLRSLRPGDLGTCEKCSALPAATKPKPLFTEKTLLTKLTSVADEIKDERLRKIMVAKDKDKQGEHGGIGTPATRDSILDDLFKRGYLERKGKNITSTKLGREFYDCLPDIAKYPDMTAIWHEQQIEIEKGRMNISTFLSQLLETVQNELSTLKRDGLPIKVDVHACPDCKKALRRIKGANGFFWGCTGYQDGCKRTFPDKKGKPDYDDKPKASQSKLYKCMDCNRPLRRVQSKKGNWFWSCSGYSEKTCSTTYFDNNGQPKYNK